MARKHSYTADFKLKLVELARSGRNLDELAVEFKLARQTFRNWLKHGDLDTGRRNDGATSAENEEIARQRYRIRQFEIEREILSKAAALLAPR